MTALTCLTWYFPCLSLAAGLTCSLLKRHAQVQGSPPEDLRGHVAIGPCLPCQPEFAFKVIAGMLVDRQ